VQNRQYLEEYKRTTTRQHLSTYVNIGSDRRQVVGKSES